VWNGRLQPWDGIVRAAAHAFNRGVPNNGLACQDVSPLRLPRSYEWNPSSWRTSFGHMLYTTMLSRNLPKCMFFSIKSGTKRIEWRRTMEMRGSWTWFLRGSRPEGWGRNLDESTVDAYIRWPALRASLQQSRFKHFKLDQEWSSKSSLSSLPWQSSPQSSHTMVITLRNVSFRFLLPLRLHYSSVYVPLNRRHGSIRTPSSHQESCLC
jgi:hypothetical protein